MRSTHSDVIDTLGSGKIDDNVTSIIETTMADIAGTYKK
jgi:F-type H+-transporting ATPase subunit alpha